MELKGLPLLLSASRFPLFLLIPAVCNFSIPFVEVPVVFVILWAFSVRKSIRARTRGEKTR